MPVDYIIRADFYPNGTIKPLGITDSEGNTQYLKEVTTVEVEGLIGFQFICLTSSDKAVILSFSEGKWTFVDN